MDEKLFSLLEKNKIDYVEHKHPAVFTVEESMKVDKKIPNIFHTKNLFLKNENSKFFLICMYAHDRLNLKSLKIKLQSKKLSFASPKELKNNLGLTPGSVSIFGMVRATDDVTLVIDKKVWNAEKVGFHPNINTATLELTHKNLEKFYNLLNSRKIILNLM